MWYYEYLCTITNQQNIARHVPACSISPVVHVLGWTKPPNSGWLQLQKKKLPPEQEGQRNLAYAMRRRSFLGAARIGLGLDSGYANKLALR
jgi:hypothetical protein